MDDNLPVATSTHLSCPILPIDTLLINPEIRQILRSVLCPFIRQNELRIVKLPPYIFANHLPSCRCLLIRLFLYLKNQIFINLLLTDTATNFLSITSASLCGFCLCLFSFNFTGFFFPRNTLTLSHRLNSSF